MVSLGRIIYLWRAEKGFTQGELSKRSGVSRPYLSGIEHGGRDVTLGTLRKLGQELGVSAGALVDGVLPTSCQAKRLTRDNLDHIAKWVSGVSIRLSVVEKEIADSLRLLVKNKTRVHGKKGRRLPRTTREEEIALLKLKIKIGSDQIKNLLNRIEKITFKNYE